MKSAASFAKGIAAGMAAGAIAATVGRAIISNRKSVSKGSAKAMRAVGDFISGVQTMVK
ncbi:MAG: hypothetical protein IKL44_06450 [Clostridia bacterium]|nr:hypothetical protein [Clostridia bacterium]MBR3594294.1 hypothetical protein [Clostridia bacterium]